MAMKCPMCGANKLKVGVIRVNCIFECEGCEAKFKLVRGDSK